MSLARSALRGLCHAPSRAFSSGAGSEKIAMVGSGNFGSALVRILGQNALRHPVFDDEVKMYVYEEMVDGEPLTQLINKHNENVKYLPGAKFTPNVVAVPDISEAVRGGAMPKSAFTLSKRLTTVRCGSKRKRSPLSTGGKPGAAESHSRVV